MDVNRITVPDDWYEPYKIALGYRIGGTSIRRRPDR